MRQLEYWLESRIDHVASDVAKIDRGAPRNDIEIDETPENGLISLDLNKFFNDEKGRPRKLHDNPEVERSKVLAYAIDTFLTECTTTSVFLPQSVIARVDWGELNCSEAHFFDDSTSEIGLFIDKFHWTINTFAAEQALTKYQESQHGKLHLDGIKKLKDMLHAVSPWNGAAVIFSEEDLPSPKELDDLLFRCYHIWPQTEGNVSRSGGRPRKQEAAAEAFLRHWPDGNHPGWKEVLRTLKEDDGLDVSVETIRRGLSARNIIDAAKP
ncbi:hypothetical protein [Ruegeria arenilitoris]|uniref:hypothetical protein n=1 Tax=Ruegeria arenilitoris TaxID=1173585 RepID=UPI00147CEC16|nr:hypothetical protein [Ruegeria arenilitoris]